MSRFWGESIELVKRLVVAIKDRDQYLTKSYPTSGVT
jgi:hypothetical protein